MIILLLLISSVPIIFGQLILGPCPYPPKFVEDLDYEKYSGTWYVVAQSRQHPMNALECQKVQYTKFDNGLKAKFNTSKNYAERQQHSNGTLSKDYMKKPGELKLSLDNFPRRYDFRVLTVNYTQVAVEYTCLSGVFNYTASLSILHRLPLLVQNVNSIIETWNLTSSVPTRLRSNMVLVNNTNCID